MLLLKIIWLYIVVRLSTVKSKTDKKCIFARFRPYIRQPDDHILRIDGVEKHQIDFLLGFSDDSRILQEF